ncbi:MAG: response regulator [Nitrospinae bacterium]|nr:response regulator [Nitrospinota bacterium]
MSNGRPKEDTRILIVDAHETSRHVIAIMLHKLGYPNVHEAETAIAAETIVKKFTKTNPGMGALLGGSAPKDKCDLDLIILDYDAESSGGGGLGYLAALRSRVDAGALPVLFTAMKDKADRLPSAQQAGANDSIVKPFPQDKLKLKIEPLLVKGKAPVITSFDFAAQPKKAAPAPVKAAQGVSPPPKPAAPMGGPPKSTAPAGYRSKEKPKKGADSSTSGISFQRRNSAKKWSADDPVTASLVNGALDGHYHEDVDVIGGGENCYWATQFGKEEKVHLYYLNAKGKSTGMEAKTVPLDEFMHTFYLCEEYGCAILDRLYSEKQGK